MSHINQFFRVIAFESKWRRQVGRMQAMWPVKCGYSVGAGSTPDRRRTEAARARWLAVADPQLTDAALTGGCRSIGASSRSRPCRGDSGSHGAADRGPRSA